jgi:HPt (histidine-containing phosphotransfer) domain-containing protein
MQSLEEIRGNLAKSVADGLKKGNVLWHNQNLPTAMPRSLVSGRNFGGVNALYLMKTAEALGYDDPRWISHPGEQKNVEPDKKILINKGEKGTTIEHWGKNKDNGIEIRTSAYFNVRQIRDKSIELLTPEGSLSREQRDGPHYERADAVLKNLDVAIPKDKSPKAYRDALSTAINNISKDAPELEKALTENLKKLRTDMAHSFLSLSLGMGVSEADKSLPVSSWANSIGHDPRQLASAARDAHRLAGAALTKGLELLESLESKEQVKEMLPNDLKAGDNIMCKKEGREFVGEVKSAENGKVVVASVLKTGEPKEYVNLHERGWKYETLSQGQEQAQHICFKPGQEVVITPKTLNENGKTISPFNGTIKKIDSEKHKMVIECASGKTYTFSQDTEKYSIDEMPYEQTLKCAHDKVQELKERKVIVSEAKTTELSRHENFKNGNVRLLDETDRYAIIGHGKEAVAPAIASIVSIGKENMDKLRETKGKDSTVLFEKANGKVTVKTPKEIVQEKEQSQTKMQGLER